MLELELVELRKPLRAFEIRRLTFLFELDFFAERIFQTALNQIDREIGDVDADPLSTEFLRCVNRRSASAEWIEYHIAGIRGGTDNSFEQRNGLLGWIAQHLFLLSEV